MAAAGIHCLVLIKRALTSAAFWHVLVLWSNYNMNTNTLHISPSSLRAQGLVKCFGKRTVVNAVSLHVEPGEVVALLGPNGAGKTTSFYMIVGLVRPTQGQVWLGQQDITQWPMHVRARHGIGYLPQEHSVFRKLSVRDNLLAVADTLSLPKAVQQQRVADHLAELGLEAVAHQMAYTLSGGERRRLEISRTLMTDPQFLLMDEPFSGVDPLHVHEVQEVVLRLKRKGLGVIITDHNVRETLRIVDRAYLLHQGRILCHGTADFLVHDPQAREFYLGRDFAL
jgi:lipopolysaccharide export system ATP-binding protein